jgi:hypothetical protein
MRRILEFSYWQQLNPLGWWIEAVPLAFAEDKKWTLGH